MTRDAKIDGLSQTTLLVRCPESEVRALAAAGDLITVRRGTLLASPEDRPNPLLLILSGDAHRFTDDGVTPCARGVLHGAAEELAGLPRNEHVVASSDATVLVVDPRRLVPLLEQCPVLTLALLRQVARDLEHTERCASSLVSSNGSTTHPWARKSRGTSTTTRSSGMQAAPGT